MPRAFRFLLAAWIVLFAASVPSDALTTGQRAVLFGSNTPAVFTDFTQLGGVLPPSLFGYAGASLRTITDATGATTYAPNNLLLNSATLSTQNVTTAPINYIVSFTGSGSIALSGTATGTVSSSPGFLKISPTAGTLTLTVSGSVTNAVMAAVTYETTPRPADQVITTSANFFGPAFDFSPTSIGTPLGLRVEESRTNLALQSTFASGWSVFSMTLTPATTTSPDNTADAATINDGVAVTTQHEIYQEISPVTASVNYTASVYAKAGIGRYLTLTNFGVINRTGGYAVFDLTTGLVTQSGALSTGTLTSASATSVGNGWYRLSLTTISADTLRYHILSSAPSATYTPDNFGRATYTGNNNTYFVWGAQFELGAFATSYIPTAAASVARAADVVTPIGALAAGLGGASGSLVVKTNDGQASSAATLVSANGTVMLGETSGNAATTALSSALTSSNTATWTGPNDVGLAWGPATGTIDLNGIATNDNHARTPSSPFSLGSTSGSSAFWDGHIKSVACYTRQLARPQ